jgi:NitT/TauT family transport system ATP-binding protein
MSAKMQNRSALLKVDKVSKQYLRGLISIYALQPVSFTVNPGEFLAFVGPSGCGKSTLLRIAGALLTPDTGSVTFHGHSLREPHPEIGVVFQKNNLMPWWTVLQNVLLPLRVQNDGIDATARQTALELLHTVGLAGFENAYPKQLSGGMNQRVALARTLIQQPKLLLMDEPFGALDALNRERLNLELLRLHETHKMTIVMVTHDITEAAFMADRILVLSERPGRIVREFTVNLPRPRKLTQMADPHFGQLILQVREALGEMALVEEG